MKLELDVGMPSADRPQAIGPLLQSFALHPICVHYCEYPLIQSWGGAGDQQDKTAEVDHGPHQAPGIRLHQAVCERAAVHPAARQPAQPGDTSLHGRCGRTASGRQTTPPPPPPSPWHPLTS